MYARFPKYCKGNDQVIVRVEILAHYKTALPQLHRLYQSGAWSPQQVAAQNYRGVFRHILPHVFNKDQNHRGLTAALMTGENLQNPHQMLD